ncbi:MAG: fasciclin domain-containing protein [Gemmatimonadales bacterium]|jgi:uncharacterized surface protein with fasciclin (FAS1) repeats|nr:MAG: fasciclin domain-containing protein [Gemmatimonadales bacterium]
MFKHLTLLSLAAAVALTGCAEDSSPTALDAPVAEGRFDNNAKVASPTIAEIAVAAASNPDGAEFTILVQALAAADLVDVFSGKGQFTVFAPTDQAFLDALAALNLEASDLLGNKELLTEILTYHVAPGRRASGSVLRARQIRTLQGGFLFPGMSDSGPVIVDGSDATPDAGIVAADIEASNGVIHVIDFVLLPG